MESKFYVDLDNSTIRLFKSDSITDEPVLKHSFNLRGSSGKVIISGKSYSMLCSLLSMIMRNKK